MKVESKDRNEVLIRQHNAPECYSDHSDRNAYELPKVICIGKLNELLFGGTQGGGDNETLP